ncbi:MAG: hypothetical protein IT372_13750 [Polyangiaceae bacterium]|nr:hypothetical protein [Polyangiaceae bacterium]
MVDVAAQDLLLYFAFMLAAMSVLSLPLAPATLLAAKTSPPLAVAIGAAIAAGCAAVFDWHFVRRAFRLRALDRLRGRSLFVKAERWATVAPFLTTAAFAGFPVPFTIVRVLMPLSGYPLRRYAAAVALGRFPRILVIAAFGSVVDVPDRILVILLVAGVAAAGIGALARHLRARILARRAAERQGEGPREGA